MSNQDTVDIVTLIENNPITRLDSTYQNKLLEKIKNKFTDSEQQMFIASCYCHLNLDQCNDFVIDLDKIWEWVGFKQKLGATNLLKSNFNIDIDYKKMVLPQNEQDNTNKHGGHNRKVYLLTVYTFKLFCLMAGTAKSTQIYKYYVNLEEILLETLNEETVALRHKLLKSVENVDLERERATLKQFPKNVQCVYFGYIDNTSVKGERLIKFGNSNDLQTRVADHKRTYLNFRLCSAFKCVNHLHIENLIKQSALIVPHKRTIISSDGLSTHNELLSIDILTVNQLDNIIQDIIESEKLTPELHESLLENIKGLESKIKQYENLFELGGNIKHFFNISPKYELTCAESAYKSTEIVCNEPNIEQKVDLVACDDPHITKPLPHIKEPQLTNHIINNENEINNTLFTKADSKFRTDLEFYVSDTGRVLKKSCIGGKFYIHISGGNVDDVWNEIAYKTTRGHTKDQYCIDKHGDIKLIKSPKVK